MNIGGFDPGKKGALVVIDEFSGKISGVFRVPLIKTTHKHRKPKKPTVTTEIDWPKLAAEWTPALKSCRHVFIEHIWGAAPAGKGRKDGGASTFKLGYAAGVPYGLMLMLNMPHTFITPQVWKGKLGYPSKPEGVETWKEPSFEFARQFFPEAVDQFERKTVDEGVAEAALIAYIGRLSLVENS